MVFVLLKNCWLKEDYQKLGGKLIYLTISRLDIAYAVSVVSRLMHSPR